MFESRWRPLLPWNRFLGRVLRNGLIAAGVVVGGLGIGVVGYHATEGLNWIDSLLDSAMILFGEGPVHPLTTTAGKIFASFYAMFSGIVFLSVTAVLFAPLFHRMIHRFHLELDEEKQPGPLQRREDGKPRTRESRRHRKRP